MANLDNVTDVFAGAVYNAGADTLTINNVSSVLPNFNTGNNVAEGAELVYALVSKLKDVVSAAGHSSLSSTYNDTFDNSALTLARAITITTVLDVAGQLDNLDVKLDSSNIVPDLALSVSDVVDYTKADDDDTTNIATITLTSDGVSVPATSTDFTLSATSNVDGTWVVVNDGGVYRLRLDNETVTSAVSPGTLHSVTISVEDNRLGVDQQPPVTVSQNINVIT